MAAPRHSCVCYTHYTNSMAAISESVSVLWMPTGQQAARLVPAVLASCDRLQQTPLALLLHCTVYAGSASTINVFWASPNATSLTSQHVRPICDCNGCPEPVMQASVLLFAGVPGEDRPSHAARGLQYLQDAGQAHGWGGSLQGQPRLLMQYAARCSLCSMPAAATWPASPSGRKPMSSGLRWIVAEHATRPAEALQNQPSFLIM